MMRCSCESEKPSRCERSISGISASGSDVEPSACADGAGDWLRATPTAPCTTIPTADFRIALQRRLRLPITGGTDEDPYGDGAQNKGEHSIRHNRVLDH